MTDLEQLCQRLTWETLYQHNHRQEYSPTSPSLAEITTSVPTHTQNRARSDRSEA